LCPWECRRNVCRCCEPAESQRGIGAAACASGRHHHATFATELQFEGVAPQKWGRRELGYAFIEKVDTHRKALTLNLDQSTFGSFAEIGAGQEVARWFRS